MSELALNEKTKIDMQELPDGTLVLLIPLDGGQKAAVPFDPIARAALATRAARGPTPAERDLMERIQAVTQKAGVDNIHHPDYYGGKDNPYEVWKIIRALRLNFFIGNALKYMVRAGKKDPAKHVEDLAKAVEYLQDEIRDIQGRKP